VSFGTVLGLVAAAALIAANGYFVAAEFAYVSARRSRFQELADGGDKRSRRALTVLKRLSFMLSGAQLGITVTSLALGFIAEPAIATVIEPVLTALGVPESASFGVSLTVALVLATILQMVFGELAPKNLAIARPERLGRLLATSTLVYMRVAGPIIKLFDSAANRLLRRIGVEPVEELTHAVSAEEFDLIIDSSHESGHLTEAQAQLLDRAIDFRELEASEAMVPWNRAVTIELTATAADLRDRMSIHSRFPVIDDEGRVRGLVHAKDLLGIERSAYDDVTVEAMMHPALFVPEAAGLTKVLGALRDHSTEMAVVIDEYGGPAGVITLEDLVEELVGDIEDEYDSLVGGDHQMVDDGVWEVAAGLRPDEIGRITGFVLPEGDYDTVAGLVLDRLERIPDTGDRLTVDGVRIDVLDADEFAIKRLQLRLDPDVPAIAEPPGDEGGRDHAGHDEAGDADGGTEQA
jgi:CBS domain containing-hemolysin-like protein